MNFGENLLTPRHTIILLAVNSLVHGELPVSVLINRDILQITTKVIGICSPQKQLTTQSPLLISEEKYYNTSITVHTV